ncbi:hypothetical protein OEZ49_11335 [Ruegeria sp. WL0004]|uniref:Uncharacterized protein n=1 Tax=Ruegeria marisflavi TaxID=2984152 RepID=A0ABT2WR50_9RHOB|nr:hypothetical protein [Ruegeria sp. WL0004]MCU9838361.1 hypothetical protein [Ruegeria sp. WL0004]
MGALDQMGYQTVATDLARPETDGSAFWTLHLRGCLYVVNAAGLLTGGDDTFQALHVSAPNSVYDYMPNDCRAVLISAVEL